MPELRKDPIMGRWVIISTERAKRPNDYKEVVNGKAEPKGGFCPFCEGNEDKTPPEIFVKRQKNTQPNTPGWNVRVVANKFPALRIEGELDRTGEDIYDKMNGIGAHEVIIEYPKHELTVSNLSLTQMEEIFYAFIERVKDLKKDSRFKYILIFKNQGEAAGASLEHTHSQLIALPIVPVIVKEEMEGCKKYYSYKERCIYCDIVKYEKKNQIRLINENEEFISISPYAPRFPFETWVLPKKHITHFENIHNSEVTALAKIMLLTLKKLDIALNCAPYNLVIHSTPIRIPECTYYHFHLEIIPKLTKVAGFEVGSGFYINPTPPEEAATFLKQINV
jgi:UDPglucose--hexose-1-phosphate uridylyltransferase